MAKYIKTVPIEAEQFYGSEDMINKYHVRCDTEYMLSDDPLEYQTTPYQMETLEGWLNIDAGDWIATGAMGEHWPIADEIFKQTYQKLPVIPRTIADWIDCNKGNQNALAAALDEDQMPEAVHNWFRYYRTRGQWQDLQDKFARAWLDGYKIEEKS